MCLMKRNGEGREEFMLIEYVRNKRCSDYCVRWAEVAMGG